MRTVKAALLYQSAHRHNRPRFTLRTPVHRFGRLCSWYRPIRPTTNARRQGGGGGGQRQQFRLARFDTAWQLHRATRSSKEMREAALAFFALRPEKSPIESRNQFSGRLGVPRATLCPPPVTSRRGASSVREHWDMPAPPLKPTKC